MINKQIIKQRKEVYGNNFPQIADSWSRYLNIQVAPKDVAFMMAELKEVRINFIKNRLQDLKNSDAFDTPIIQAEIKTLNYGLEDSKTDKENYLWIGTNYKEYENL